MAIAIVGAVSERAGTTAADVAALAGQSDRSAPVSIELAGRRMPRRQGSGPF